jgi:pimeloyl-ACP methyl ester carboxylesterase
VRGQGAEQGRGHTFVLLSDKRCRTSFGKSFQQGRTIMTSTDSPAALPHRAFCLGAVKKLSIALVTLLAGAVLIYVSAGYYGSGIFRFLPVANPGADRPAIVVLSGDMGDRIGMTAGIADRLNARGYAVVSVNSLAYFSRRRTAADVAALIEAAMTHAEALGRTRKVVLIGQSLGADMLHVGLARLAVADHASISAVILVVPGREIIFRASPIELLGLETPDQPALSTASSLTWVPVTCIFGKAETESLCPELKLPNLRRIELPGGHQLRFDDEAVERAILQAIPQSGALERNRATPSRRSTSEGKGR